MYSLWSRSDKHEKWPALVGPVLCPNGQTNCVWRIKFAPVFTVVLHPVICDSGKDAFPRVRKTYYVLFILCSNGNWVAPCKFFLQLAVPRSISVELPPSPAIITEQGFFLSHEQTLVWSVFTQKNSSPVQGVPVNLGQFIPFHWWFLGFLFADVLFSK